MNGSDTITGGIIIMPRLINAPLTTMSMTRNGMKMMNPMMKASLSSERTNAGMSVAVETSSRFSGSLRLTTLVSSVSSSSPVLSSMNARKGSMPSWKAAEFDLSPSR
ncbi:hypothetical protein D9M69_715400 [compost metagenome]